MWILCHIFPPWVGGAPCGLRMAAGASLFRGQAVGLNSTFFSSYYQRSSVLQGPLGSTWDSYSREGRLTKQDSRYPPWIAPVVSPSCIPVPGSLERSGAQCCPLGAQVPGEYVWKGCPSRPDIQEVSQPGQGCGILRPSSIHGGDKQNSPEEKKGYY